MTTDTITEDTAVPYQELTIGSLQPHPNNIRANLGDLEELTASIKAAGVLNPITVVPATAKGKYRIIAGHRRHAAAKAAGQKRVPCIVRTDLDDPVDQIVAMITENGHRADLTVLDESQAYQELLDLDGITVKDAATRTGVSQRKVRDRIKIATAPDSVKAAIAEKSINLEDALFIATHSDNDEDRKDLEEALGTTQWSFAKTRVTRRVKRRKAIAAMEKAAADTGVPVFPTSLAMQDAFREKAPLNTTIREVKVFSSQDPPTATDVKGYQPGELHGIVARGVWFDVHRFEFVPDEPGATAEPTDPADYATESQYDTADTDDPATAPAEPEPAAPPVEPTAEELAELKRTEDLATAAEVRATFLKEAIAAADPDKTVVAFKAALRFQAGGDLFPSQDEFALLGLDDPGNHHARIEVFLEWVDAQTSLTPLAWAFAVIGLIGAGLNDLAQHGFQHESDDWAGMVITLLPAIGYVWSDVERAELASADE